MYTVYAQPYALWLIHIEYANVKVRTR